MEPARNAAPEEVAATYFQAWRNGDIDSVRPLLHPDVDFTGLRQIRDRLAAFETRYNAIARPFNWKFTRTDLHDLLHRIDAHDTTQPHALAA